MFSIALDHNVAKWGAGFAIDGLFHDSSLNYGFYHPYNNSPNDWLQINMGQEETLCKVQLYARTDADWGPQRRANIEVRVGNIPASTDITGNPLCAITKSNPSSHQTTLRCATALTGTLIVIWQPIREYWSMDEVFAFSI